MAIGGKFLFFKALISNYIWIVFVLFAERWEIEALVEYFKISPLFFVTKRSVLLHSHLITFWITDPETTYPVLTIFTFVPKQKHPYQKLYNFSTLSSSVEGILILFQFPETNLETGPEISYNHNKTHNKLRRGIFTMINTYKTENMERCACWT